MASSEAKCSVNCLCYKCLWLRAVEANRQCHAKLEETRVKLEEVSGRHDRHAENKDRARAERDKLQGQNDVQARTIDELMDVIRQTAERRDEARGKVVELEGRNRWQAEKIVALTQGHETDQLRAKNDSLEASLKRSVETNRRLLDANDAVVRRNRWLEDRVEGLETQAEARKARRPFVSLVPLDACGEPGPNAMVTIDLSDSIDRITLRF
jgi:chromosome segregation ATPase